MDLAQAIRQGLNEVTLDEEHSAGYLITLSHKATTDNAVTVFVPKTGVICWANYEDDESLELGIRTIVANEI